MSGQDMGGSARSVESQNEHCYAAACGAMLRRYTSTEAQHAVTAAAAAAALSVRDLLPSAEP